MTWRMMSLLPEASLYPALWWARSIGGRYRLILPSGTEEGDVVGVLEAMKVFNEVESPVGGVVRKFLATDGQLVQEGEPLLLIEP